MASLFVRQFGALFLKNWIVLARHPFLNALRCLILPIAYGTFLAVAQTFFSKPSNFGIGSPVPINTLSNAFDGSLALIWTDGTGGNVTGSLSPAAVISHITRGFSASQIAAVKQVPTQADIPRACPQNFNLFSQCFAAVSFNSMPSTGQNNTSPINYTMSADAGLYHIDVVRHTSDYETRILPLQWAIDQAIIELSTGQVIPTPLEWPFSQETNTEQNTLMRLSYIRGIRSLLVIALFVCYIGISYQLPGSFTGERSNLLTSHLKVMGLRDSARVISWHLSVSLAYLPAWIIVALIWHYRVFSGTNVGLVLAVHILLGLSLASWSFFLAVPFSRSPQLSAIASTLISLIFAILALVFSHATSGVAFVFSVLFPSGFYVFAIRAICGFENHRIPTNALKPDPDNNLRLIVFIVAAIINIVLWPSLAVLLEQKLYDAPDPTKSSWFRKRPGALEGGSHIMPPDTAISIQNLGKDFTPPLFSSTKGLVTAVADLSFSIPKFGIFVLLGSNGAGKSTVLSILGGLLGHTRGSILFEGGVLRPPRGTIGIVPQKNVLFPELTCYQTLRVWAAVKGNGPQNEDLEQLLRDCDLGAKIHSNADTLSGGQKRKLQLAIGLVGGSKIVLVDECTSGVDPLSRRALWRTLSSVRYDRTIVFTTHFLDEADLLADDIAILAAPGKMVAHGTPVMLKSTLGQGYTIQTTFRPSNSSEREWTPPSDLLDSIRRIAPTCYVSIPAPHQASFHLMLKEPQHVAKVLRVLESEAKFFALESYDVLGTSIEDIFLELMNKEQSTEKVDSVTDEGESDAYMHSGKPLELTTGQKRSPFFQAFTIFYKRALIARRAWLTPVLSVLVAVAGSCIPLFYLPTQQLICTTSLRNTTTVPLYLPFLPQNISSDVLVSPSNVTRYLGSTGATLRTQNITDNSTFVNDIKENYQNITLGGLSMDFSTGNSLIAWEASPPGLNGLRLLNLASNILYSAAGNTTPSSRGSLIAANYASFPAVSARTLVDLKWVAFFGAAMSVFPAFFSLYVSRERRAFVQAMQFSNGLANPAGLWLGHLMFDTIFSVISATIITIVFATASNQFHGLGFFWLIMVLYGIVAALFSYCVSLIMTSPLSSFAVSAGYQIIMFLLYIAGYLLTFTYAQSSKAAGIVSIIHFTVSIASPVASVLRAAFVSVNLFSLLCDGQVPVTTGSLGSLTRYGGPILYLFVYGFVLFAILVWYDSGTLLPRGSRNTRLGFKKRTRNSENPVIAEDVEVEAKAVATSQDSLRVLGISKTFGKNTVVDNVSFGVARGDVLALLGPNGAGKTTTFNVIRGDVIPDEGDVIINDISVIRHPRGARLSLGVCPQFTAIDSQLTVREHLEIYGRLKGIPRGSLNLDRDVNELMQATSLFQYADRLASKLSGGNQRKLALAIAMIGNPTNLLIDEFSTGIDAKMKRDMWRTLRNVAIGKAVIITTHSMEEASALANKAGILATRMLAVGTIDSLAARYASYEVHFSCRTREETVRAQEIMARIPGARLADDLATRFEVPIAVDNTEGGMTLQKLFDLLSTQTDFVEYTVERATLESAFLKVIRENNFAEEDRRRGLGWWRRLFGV